MGKGGCRDRVEKGADGRPAADHAHNALDVPVPLGVSYEGTMAVTARCQRGPRGIELGHNTLDRRRDLTLAMVQ
jgi:hypothetical protein